MALHPWNIGSYAYEHIQWIEVTGKPADLLDTLNRKVGALCRDYGYHRKIGITNDPVTRWNRAYKRNGWLRMNVIFYSFIADDVDFLEKHFVGRFRNFVMSSEGYFYNEKDGGGGPKAETGPYYLYLVTAPRWSRITK